jgi:hypothetical protein
MDQLPRPTDGVLYSSAINLTSTSHLRAIAVREGVAGPISGENFIRLAADLVNYESDLPLMIIDNFGAGTVPCKKAGVAPDPGSNRWRAKTPFGPLSIATKRLVWPH